jgi:hypothetical protein
MIHKKDQWEKESDNAGAGTFFFKGAGIND